MSSLAIAWIAVAFLVARAQTAPHGGTLEYLGVERDKPFTAERVTRVVTHSDGTADTSSELFELMARDSAGRIRIERRGLQPPAKASEEIEGKTLDGKTFTTTRELAETVVLIMDYSHGTRIQLRPGMQIAWTRTIHPITPGGPGDRPYSSYFGTQARPNTEDLGNRAIEGIMAHGFRQTQLGTEKDGDWNGKPIRVWERWVSDDLAVTLLETMRDLRNNKERTTTLGKIRREEPDPSLFEIPSGYTVNRTPENMPRVFGNGKPTSQP